LSTSHADAQIELHRKLAPRYELRYAFEFSRLFEEDWHAEILSHVPAGPGRVMDLGCGTGLFLQDILRREERAVGIDISFDMLEVGRRAMPGAPLVTADAERLPVRPGTFKAVVCKGSLHHARDHARFIENCARSLTDGGVLVMSEPCNDNPLIRLARWVLYRKSEHFDEGDQGFRRRDLVELYRRGGFDVVTVRKYGFLAYALCGFPDHVGILRHVPGSALLSRLFIRVDRVVCAVPLLRLLAFQVVVVGRPRGSA
jgi:SAM-dependent methyltransferase